VYKIYTILLEKNLKKFGKSLDKFWELVILQLKLEISVKLSSTPSEKVWYFESWEIYEREWSVSINSHFYSF
jgi:hypothetical protein